jgi:hypothetical protein
VVNANPTLLDHVIRLYLAYIFLLSGQQALASHWLEKVPNSTLPFLIIDQFYTACY